MTELERLREENRRLRMQLDNIKPPPVQPPVERWFVSDKFVSSPNLVTACTAILLAWLFWFVIVVFA